jgi:predicted HAD superfamily Cof-like phosphohydrolase
MKYSQIKEFNGKFDFGTPEYPTDISIPMELYRLGLLKEEVIEYEEAVDGLAICPNPQDRTKLLDAMVDIIYVVMGTAMMHGFDLEEAFNRVHQANMAKVRAQVGTQSKRGSHFDVIKPPGWEAPDLSDLTEVDTVGDLLCEMTG